LSFFSPDQVKSGISALMVVVLSLVIFCSKSISWFGCSGERSLTRIVLFPLYLDLYTRFPLKRSLKIGGVYRSEKKGSVPHLYFLFGLGKAENIKCLHP
jgi:hypothetical protein